MDKKYIWSITIVSIILFSGILFFIFSGSESFETNSIVVKNIVRQGEQVDGKVIVTNILDSAQRFNVRLTGLNGVGNIEEDSFIISQNGFKEIFIKFSNSSKITPGVYVGKLHISTEKSERQIPVILEVQSEHIIYATNLEVSQAYEEINPNEKFTATLKILNLGSEKQISKITYSIKDLNSRTVIKETEEIGVNNEISLVKSMALPAGSKYDNYAFCVEIKYKDTVSTASHVFNFKKKQLIKFDYVTTIIFLLIVGAFVLSYFMFKERNNLVLQMRKQQREEMRVIIREIGGRRRGEIKKAKNREQRAAIMKMYKLTTKKAIKELQEKHKKQETKLEKIKDRKEKSEQIEKWINQGINIGELGVIINKSKPTIKDLAKNGYDVSVLTE